MSVRFAIPGFVSSTTIAFTAIAFIPFAFGAENLSDAVTNGDKAAVRVLLQQGAGVNATMPDGTTALHWAVRSEDLEIADMLIRAGADVKVADRLGVTPIYLASLNGSEA